MKNNIIIAGIISVLFCTSTVMASEHPRIMPCNRFSQFKDVKQQITKLNPKFQWDSTDCQIVGTRSLFPKKTSNGELRYQRGLQLAVYMKKQLQYLCMPGWVCKPW